MFIAWNRTDRHSPWREIGQARTEAECWELVHRYARSGENDVAVKGRAPGTDYFFGLDIGQQQEFTALVIMERTYVQGDIRDGRPTAHYGARHMRRWPLGTGYAAIITDVAELLLKPELGKPMLIVDETAVGRPIADLLARGQLNAWLWRAVITNGHEATCQNGVWSVPKKVLVSELQVLLQARRLRIAEALPDAAILSKELAAFRMKAHVATDATIELWRERDHDDMVFAVALAAWLGEQRPRVRHIEPVVVRKRTLEDRRAESPVPKLFRERPGLFGHPG
jgi:hypothetical protein